MYQDLAESLFSKMNNKIEENKDKKENITESKVSEAMVATVRTGDYEYKSEITKTEWSITQDDEAVADGEYSGAGVTSVNLYGGVEDLADATLDILQSCGNPKGFIDESKTNEEMSRDVFDRIEGIIYQNELDSLKEAATSIAQDLLHDGFDSSDVIEYLTNTISANVVAVFDTVGGADEQEEPPVESKKNERKTLAEAKDKADQKKKEKEAKDKAAKKAKEEKEKAAKKAKEDKAKADKKKSK